MSRIFEQIGHILAADTAYPLDGTFLYVECEAGMITPSVYRDLGDHLLYRLPNNALCDALIDLWESEAPEKRWAAMEYAISGGKFDATFTYPGEFDRAGSSRDRRRAILARRFGNKRIVYPPLADDDEGLDFQL